MDKAVTFPHAALVFREGTRLSTDYFSIVRHYTTPNIHTSHIGTNLYSPSPSHTHTHTHTHLFWHQSVSGPHVCSTCTVHCTRPGFNFIPLSSILGRSEKKIGGQKIGSLDSPPLNLISKCSPCACFSNGKKSDRERRGEIFSRQFSGIQGQTAGRKKLQRPAVWSG